MTKDKQLLKMIMDKTPLCFNLWTRDLENIMCNQSAVELFDLKNESEYLERFFELSPYAQPDGTPSDVLARRKIAEAFDTGKCVFSWMHCKLNGERIPCEITMVRLDNKDNAHENVVAGYTRDLREQKAAEEAERKLRQRIQAMLDVTPLACVLIRPDGRAIDCNQKAVDFFGVESKEEVIRNFLSFHPEYQPDGSVSAMKITEKIANAFHEKQMILEWIHVNKKGEYIPSEVILEYMQVEDGETIAAFIRDLRDLNQTLEVDERLKELTEGKEMI